jgi:hypothetical protein
VKENAITHYKSVTADKGENKATRGSYCKKWAILGNGCVARSVIGDIISYGSVREKAAHEGTDEEHDEGETFR